MEVVCKNCFLDQELVGFIISQGRIGNCDCCGSQNVEIIKLIELLDFFKELFDNFKIQENGESLISIIQEKWNFFRDTEYGNKILKETLEKTNSIIKNPSDFVTFSDDIIENQGYWSVLKKQLKEEKRYFTNIETLTDDYGWDSFFESKTSIKDTDVYYRARLHNDSSQDTYQREEMSCPPAKFASAGRANPAGIPYLYLSDNENTILYEIRATYLDEISVGTFTKNEEYEEEILISDFTENSTLYHPSEVNKRIKAKLLKEQISKDLSKPMRRYDSELDYIPTQFICEFIKVFTNVQGIKFRSSLHKEGCNLVIFNDKIMKCRDVKKIQVTEVNIQAKNV